MSNNNNDIGNVMKSQGYYVPTPSIPSPMPSKDNISSIPIPVGMRGSSDMDNDVLSREGSRSIPSLVEGIKNSVETSYHDDVKARNPLFQMINETGIPKGNYDITGSRINLRDSRYRLSTGEWIPKYESYINNVDNDDRLSRSQSGWEKTYRGLGKFIYKSALYGIGGVGQSVYGLKELVTKGRYQLCMITVLPDGWMIWISVVIIRLIIITVRRSEMLDFLKVCLHPIFGQMIFCQELHLRLEPFCHLTPSPELVL